MKKYIYEIWIGDYYYHGQTNDINRRRAEHLVDLMNNKHCNKFMQNVWNKYKTFEMQILAECTEVTVDAYEQDYIDANWGLKYYLNMNPKAEKPPSWKGIKRGPQTDQQKLNVGLAKSKAIWINGLRYESRKEASQKLNIDGAAISRWANGLTKCRRGWEVYYENIKD